MKIKLIALACLATAMFGVSCSRDPDLIVVRPGYSTYHKPAPTSLERDVERASSFNAVRSWDANN